MTILVCKQLASEAVRQRAVTWLSYTPQKWGGYCTPSSGGWLPI